MPDLLHELTGAKRDAAVDDLVHFLVGQGGPLKPSGSANAKEIARGKDLYHGVGCVACHQAFEPAPKQKIDPNARKDDDDDPKVPAKADSSFQVPLGDQGLKTTTEALSRFLVNPLHARPSGRMPGMNLSPADATAIAAYLRSLPAQSAPVSRWIPSEQGAGESSLLRSAALHATILASTAK
jgi:mono/diheme cytochrome c family protein